MGSTHAWLGAPWDDRGRPVVCNDGLPTSAGTHREHLRHCFSTYIEAGTGHSLSAPMWRRARACFGRWLGAA